MRFVCLVASVYIPGSGGVRVYVGTGVHVCGCNSLLPASLRSTVSSVICTEGVRTRGGWERWMVSRIYRGKRASRLELLKVLYSTKVMQLMFSIAGFVIVIITHFQGL